MFIDLLHSLQTKNRGGKNLKKNMIATLLAIVMAAGSIGTIPVMAAESTERELETVEENTEETPIETFETIEGLSEGEPLESAEDTSEGEPLESVEDTSEGESVESVENEPELDSNGLAEKSETETFEEVEMTVDEEEEESTDIADTSAEMAEAEEPAATVEGVTTEAEGKEAKYAGSGSVYETGNCGKSATWTLTGEENDLTLTISGSGDMIDCRSGTTTGYTEK